MIQQLLIGVALAAAGWCIWVRRHSWRCRKDAALTLGIAFTGIGLFLAAPFQNRYLGTLGYTLTGIGHIDTYIGQMCMTSSGACVIYAVASRLVPDHHIEKVMRRVEYPNALAATIMLAMLISSPKMRHQPHCDFFAIPPGPYLAVYWAAFLTLITYQLAYMIRILLILRRDPRSRLSANLFIFAASLGLLWVAATTAHFVIPHCWITPTALWVLVCGPATIVGLAGAASWRKRPHDRECQDV